jgi:hypothetical protein
MGIISSRAFWSTAHDCTNDEAEIKSANPIILEAARACLRNAKEAAYDLFSVFIHNFDNMHIIDRRTIYLCCFSSERDGEHLWRMYGKNGDGVCLGIRVLNDDPRPVHPQQVSFTADVIYSEQSLRENVTQAFRKVATLMSSARRTKANLQRGRDALYRISAICSVTAKDVAWQDEREVRHVTFYRDEHGFIPNERTTADGKVVRYTPVLVRQEGKRIAFAEIIIGSKRNFEKSKEELEAHLAACGYTKDCIEYPEIKVSEK